MGKKNKTVAARGADRPNVPAYLPAATMLNYHWEQHVGSIEKGKFADIIAVAGNPLVDVSEMQRIRFVMKGGLVVRNENGRP